MMLRGPKGKRNAKTANPEVCLRRIFSNQRGSNRLGREKFHFYEMVDGLRIEQLMKLGK